MRKFTHATFQSGEWMFVLVLSRSTYCIKITKAGELYKREPERGRKGGLSATDALASAAYSGNPERAASLMHYLFGPDEQPLLDAWDCAKRIAYSN